MRTQDYRGIPHLHLELVRISLHVPRQLPGSGLVQSLTSLSFQLGHPLPACRSPEWKLRLSAPRLPSSGRKGERSEAMTQVGPNSLNRCQYLSFSDENGMGIVYMGRGWGGGSLFFFFFFFSFVLFSSASSASSLLLLLLFFLGMGIVYMEGVGGSSSSPPSFSLLPPPPLPPSLPPPPAVLFFL